MCTVSIVEHPIMKLKLKQNIAPCDDFYCAQPEVQCREALCDASNGTAVCAAESQTPTGTPCNDNNAATNPDVCDASGSCVGTGNKNRRRQ